MVISRRRRLYKSLILEDLLEERNLKTEYLMPKQQPDVNTLLNRDDSDPAPFPAYLPLHIFDDDDYDCRTPQEWMSLSEKKNPIPGLALLPTKEEDKFSVYFLIL